MAEDKKTKKMFELKIKHRDLPREIKRRFKGGMKEVYDFIQEEEENVILNPLNGKVGLLLSLRSRGKEVKFLHDLTLKLKKEEKKVEKKEEKI